MSLSRNGGVVLVARKICRELRRRTTPAERIFWEKTRDRRFLGLKFYRQHPLFVDLDGRETFFVADFYCHQCTLVVEIDGKIHRYQKHHDAARSKVINNLGVMVVRFKNEEIEKDIAIVLGRLENVIKRRSHSEQLPLLFPEEGVRGRK